ncbi:MAG: sec-independent protein translocase protein TatA [Bryobacterales bacterium]|jgi:TatA/E family protein of Tat protein translocase|nr:sec-independent protein translocase protein TatA [Bryobacterales bacterium]
MGPLGTGEIVFIFVLALLLFGPKELPKIGKTIGKAMTEFRRAQSELKSTFDREMVNLERETGIKELVETSYQPDSYNYDYSSHDSSYYDGSYDSTVTNTTTTGASATLGAGSSAPLQLEAAAGSIASGHMEAGHGEHAAVSETPAANGHFEPGHDAVSHETAPVATEKPVNS